jgi:hypothetical protein
VSEEKRRSVAVAISSRSLGAIALIAAECTC